MPYERSKTRDLPWPPSKPQLQKPTKRSKSRQTLERPGSTSSRRTFQKPTGSIKSSSQISKTTTRNSARTALRRSARKP